MKFTSVVGYHMNPLTCGVAKFNEQLAKRLGVPFVEWNHAAGSFPLLSLKLSEFDTDDYDHLTLWLQAVSYGVFWHDRGHDAITAKADVVFYADSSLGTPGLWCPSLLTPSKTRTVRLFSFGMAHKLQTQHYVKVRRLLEAAGLDYTLRVSVGLHEGTSLSDATQHFDDLKAILGPDKVMILGILSDDAVIEELQRTDYVLAFFENGVRDNNTTVHAALEYGKRVITNHDGQTGHELSRHTINIHDWSVWPSTALWTWDQLISEMERICAATNARQPAR